MAIRQRQLVSSPAPASHSQPGLCHLLVGPGSGQAGNKSNTSAEKTDEEEKEDRVVLFTPQADQKQLY